MKNKNRMKKLKKNVIEIKKDKKLFYGRNPS